MMICGVSPGDAPTREVGVDGRGPAGLRGIIQDSGLGGEHERSSLGDAGHRDTSCTWWRGMQDAVTWTIDVDWPVGWVFGSALMCCQWFPHGSFK